MGVCVGSLTIDQGLYDFIVKEALPDTGVSEERFWAGLEEAVEHFGKENKLLLQKRDLFQQELDQWYRAHKGTPIAAQEQIAFLRSIGYLVEADGSSRLQTQGVDPEIALSAGAQLVVPADNARYALNAANARWGSLLDVLYGTDMIDHTLYPITATYNEERGNAVFAYAFAFLDSYFPLSKGSYSQISHWRIEEGMLKMELASDQISTLQEPSQWVGYTMGSKGIASIVLKHHGLHVEIQIDPESPIGKHNAAGIKDIVLEAALSAIADCEDSVAAVDASDKVNIYRNLLGLMRGDLACTFENKGKVIHRALNPDRQFTTPEGGSLTLKGRVLLLVRNVGIHMYTDAITCKGEAIPEGFMDAFVTALCAMHDLKKSSGVRNSVCSSLYIVKPKCHGPEEIAFVSALFSAVEETLGLPRHTIKMGLMDEERRTSANLQACIAAAAQRVFFINTGFLDRTGDEIHSVMELGPVPPKEQIKQALWLKSYEDQNVDVGLAMGFRGRAQIGKGMWTMPDAMKKMVEVKIAHVRSGASTAWVPSPTAATLHALHYHAIDVLQQQEVLRLRTRASIEELLTPALLEGSLSPEQIQEEIENNAQSILGYVVRWVDQGIGCSKVPDIRNNELMEDRATLRISSQHMANWLHHGIITREQVLEAFKKMAVVVDAQNAKDPHYRAMAPDFEKSIAFEAALALVFEGRDQPNGYTEHLLHVKRIKAKQRGA